jgi:formamidopyrimidine-DNA glycosylase
VLRYPARADFSRRLKGRRLLHLGRQGKFILVELDRARGAAVDGEIEFVLIHLGMTGRLQLSEPETPPPPHTHLRLRLSSGVELRMQDYRRFGRVLLGTPAELVAAGVFPRLGPEPVTGATPNPGAWNGFAGALSEVEFSRILAASRRPIKALLLEQGKIAGLGNIYTDEACFRAGVRPTAVAARIGPARRRRLHAAISDVLRAAVDLRGSSIDDYRDGFGEKGQNQNALLVYGRGGAPCVRCGGRLRKTVVAGRTTVYCPRCQR